MDLMKTRKTDRAAILDDETIIAVRQVDAVNHDEHPSELASLFMNKLLAIDGGSYRLKCPSTSLIERVMHDSACP
jgi:hypothetical protein